MQKAISKLLGIVGSGIFCIGACFTTERFWWLPAVLMISALPVLALSIWMDRDSFEPEEAAGRDRPCIQILDEQDNVLTIAAPLTDFTLTYLQIKAKEYDNERNMERI